MHTDRFEWKNTSKSLILSLLMLVSALTAGLESFEKPSNLLEEEIQADWNQRNHQPETDIDTWNLTNSTSNFDVGDIVYVEIDSFDLTINNSYSLDWSLDNGSQTGSFSWTAYNSSSSEDVNLSGLSAGTHCITAELFDTSNNSSLDFDYTCFTVNSASTGYVAIMLQNNVYNYGDNVYADFDLWNLIVNNAYDLTWSLDNGSQTGTFSWNASNTWGAEQLMLSGLSPGYYCIEATLYDSASSSSLSSDSACFTVNAPTPNLNVHIPYSNYNYGSNVSVDIYIDNLSVNNNYSLDWSLGNVSQTGSFSWTANSSSLSDYFTLSGLSSGYYCFDAVLFDSNNTSLASDSECFTIDTAPPLYVNVHSHSSYYTYGSTFDIDINSYNLNVSDAYSIDWSLNNGSQTGSFSWTANSSSNYESVTFSGLSLGYYCLDAVLFDSNNTSLSSDSDCFTISAVPTPQVYVFSYNSYYTYGSTVEIDINSYNLNISDAYSIDWSLNNGSQTGSFSWTANNSSGNNYEYLTFSGLSSGYYCIDAVLFDSNNTSLSSNSGCFTVGPPPSVEIYALDYYNYVGNLVEIDIVSADLTFYDNYVVDWSLDNGSQTGSFSWTAYDDESIETEELSGLSVGLHCLSAEIFDNNNNSLDSDYSCFEVVTTSSSTPQVSIDALNSSYSVGDTVYLVIEMWDLSANLSHLVDWFVYDASTGALALSGDYYVNNANYSFQNLNITGLASGSYYIGAYISVTGSLIAENSTYLIVNAAQTSYPEVDILVNSTYMVGDVVSFNIHSFNLTLNNSYAHESAWYDSSGAQYGFGNNTYSWTAYNNYDDRYLNLTGLPVGQYCIDTAIYDITTGSWVGGGSAWECFSVVSNSTSPAPEVDILVNYTYLLGDVVDFTIHSFNLTLNNSYAHESTWYDSSGAQYGFGNTYNWTAYNYYDDRYLNLTGLPVGQYCIDTTIYDITTGSWVGGGSAWECFSVVTANVTTPSVWSWPGEQYYYSGATVEYYIDSSDLIVNDSYTMEWTLYTNDSDDGVQSGNYTWNAYTNSSTEQLNFTGLSAGTYCIGADLYGDAGNWLIGDLNCFTVSSDPAPQVSITPGQTNYYVGDTIDIHIDSWDLIINNSYTAEWSLNNGNENSNYTWNAYYNYSSELLNLTGLSAGTYCIDVDLIDWSSGPNAIFADHDSDCFNILEQITEPSINLFVYNYNVSTGTSAEIDFEVSNLTIGQSYTMEWYLNSSTLTVPGSYSWWNENTSFTGTWNSGYLPAGNYCFHINVIQYFAWEYDCFTVNTATVADSDGDGFSDDTDLFPNNPNEWNDTDMDGFGDNSDMFPEDSNEWNDTDMDGFGDNSDMFPEDSNEWNDTDMDGYGDNSDAFPNNYSESSDLDGDGVGDNSDDCNNTAAGVTVDDLGCAISIPETSVMAIGIVDSSTGNQIILVVEPTDTVASVKAKIQVELGISPDEQTLMFGLNELDDDDVLADKNIVASSMLYLVLSVEDTAPTCYVYYWLGSAGTPQNDWNWTEMMSGWNEFNAPENGEFTLALPKGDYFVYFGCWDEQGDDITLAVDGLPEIQEFQADENWVWGWDEFTISDTDVGVQHDMIVTWSSTDFGGNVTIHFKGVETVLDSAVESDTSGLPGFPASLALVSLLGAAVILSRREE